MNCCCSDGALMAALHYFTFFFDYFFQLDPSLYFLFKSMSDYKQHKLSSLVSPWLLLWSLLTGSSHLQARRRQTSRSTESRTSPWQDQNQGRRYGPNVDMGKSISSLKVNTTKTMGVTYSTSSIYSLWGFWMGWTQRTSHPLPQISTWI